MANELLNEFVETFQTIKSSGSFVIDDAFFTIIVMGKGFLAYHARIWNDRLFPSAREQLELAAVKDKEGTIHIMRVGCFGQLDAEDMPEGAKIFSSDETSKASDGILADMFDDIPTYGIKLSDDDAVKLDEAAWIFGLEPEAEMWRPTMRVPDEDAIEVFLGLTTAEALAKERLDSWWNEWIKKKAVQERALELSARFTDSEAVKIYQSLNEIDAKNVNVTFEKEGQKASAKCDPQDVRRIIKNRRDFSPYGDFSSSKAGEDLFWKLFRTRGYSSANQLLPADIVKITHGKTVLYERKVGDNRN